MAATVALSLHRISVALRLAGTRQRFTGKLRHRGEVVALLPDAVAVVLRERYQLCTLI
jgi:hypothetical protein